MTAAVFAHAATLGAQSLRGSPASMDRQDRRARVNNFTFLQTARDVKRFVNAGLLVPVKEDGANYFLKDVSFEVARPAVKLFIDRLSSQYHRACGSPLVVTSLTRPLSDQPENASPRSVHPTGMAVDLRRPQNRRCLGWLESTLLSLERRGVIEATLEHYPPHLHVAVFPQNYMSYVAAITGRSVDEVMARAMGNPSYTVRSADTLWKISRRYGTTPGALRSANHLRSSLIRPGDVLEIPVGDDSRP